MLDDVNDCDLLALLEAAAGRQQNGVEVPYGVGQQNGVEVPYRVGLDGYSSLVVFCNNVAFNQGTIVRWASFFGGVGEQMLQAIIKP